jgi:hypothetical protein
MDAQTIAHVPPSHKTPLHLETTTRALRHSVWLSLYLAQDLQLPGLQHALTRTLVEIDRLLEELDAA